MDTDDKNASTPSLEAAQIQEIRSTRSGVLALYVRGRKDPIERIRVRPCFPWSSPDRYLSLCDSDGRELVLLDSLDDVPPAVREAIRAEIQITMFHPVIRRVLSRRNEFGVLSLDVETDRGRTTFQVRSRDDVRFLSDRRVLLKDPDGIVYEIPDLGALDAGSRRCLEEFV